MERSDGFFKGSVFIDIMGMGNLSALSGAFTKNAEGKYINDIVSEWKAPYDLVPEIATGKHSIHNDHGALPDRYFEAVTGWSGFSGIVLAAQDPQSKEVLQVGNDREYYGWLYSMCRRYSGGAYIKVDPRCNPGESNRVFAESGLHGTLASYAPIQILDKCSSLYVYNSDFVLDAWARGIHTQQYAHGLFGWVPCDIEFRKHLINFICYKCLIPFGTNEKNQDKLNKAYHFKNKQMNLFPLPESLSWGAMIQKSLTGKAVTTRSRSKSKVLKKEILSNSLRENAFVSKEE